MVSRVEPRPLTDIRVASLFSLLFLIPQFEDRPDHSCHAKCGNEECEGETEDHEKRRQPRIFIQIRSADCEDDSGNRNDVADLSDESEGNPPVGFREF